MLFIYSFRNYFLISSFHIRKENFASTLSQKCHDRDGMKDNNQNKNQQNLMENMFYNQKGFDLLALWSRCMFSTHLLSIINLK